MSNTDADRRDTPRAAPWAPRRIHRPGVTVASAALLLLLVSPAKASEAAGVAIVARVVWVNGDAVYIASPDSIAVQKGTRLTFLSRGKPAATGEVSEVLDRSVARVWITSGVLPDPKHLERLSILAEPPPAPQLVRIGFPASGRRPDPLRCSQRFLAVDTATHRIEAAGRGLRITRLPDSPAARSWPDTMIVQLFDDAADEEIALERGELELGVFWPDELSAHMREHPRWRDPLTAPTEAPGRVSLVLCDPDLRPLVKSVGARAFAELYRCPGDPR